MLTNQDWPFTNLIYFKGNVDNRIIASRGNKMSHSSDFMSRRKLMTLDLSFNGDKSMLLLLQSFVSLRPNEINLLFNEIR